MWFKQYYKRYPHAGFGQMFSSWANSKTIQIQRSFGNGAAMRISAIGFAFSSIKEIKREAIRKRRNKKAYPKSFQISFAYFR